jgi:hypothetical protein
MAPSYTSDKENEFMTARFGGISSQYELARIGFPLNEMAKAQQQPSRLFHCRNDCSHGVHVQKQLDNTAQ